MKIPFLRDSEIAEAAGDLCDRAFAPHAWSIPILLDRLLFDYLCEEHGLIFSDEEPLDRIDGIQVLGRTDLLAGRISIDSDLKQAEPRRYRFTVAHELGHWILHRPLALAHRDQPELFPHGTVLVSKATDSSELTAASGTSMPVEWQANRFASHLLVPRTHLVPEFRVRFGEKPPCLDPGVALRVFARSLARQCTAQLPPLIDAFDASTEAIAIAIEDSRLVSLQPLLL